MFEQVIENCQYLLNNFPGASQCKQYLDSRLNTTSQEMFGFGYFPDFTNLSALTSMVGADYLIENRLLYFKQYEDSTGYQSIGFPFFENHPLIMPFRDPYGDIVGVVGRSLLSDAQRKNLNIEKYKNTHTTKFFTKGNLLFGLYENKQSILDKDLVYLVEGQFDVIKAVEKGITNIVALGTNNMSSYQFSVISRYTDNIILLLDNDEAGNRGRKRITDKFGKYANIQNWYLSEKYKDIDEYFTNSGEKNLSFVIRD